MDVIYALIDLIEAAGCEEMPHDEANNRIAAIRAEVGDDEFFPCLTSAMRILKMSGEVVR